MTARPWPYGTRVLVDMGLDAQWHRQWRPHRVVNDRGLWLRVTCGLEGEKYKEFDVRPFLVRLDDIDYSKQ